MILLKRTDICLDLSGGEKPVVVFSGDGLNPSMLSLVTRGKFAVSCYKRLVWRQQDAGSVHLIQACTFSSSFFSGMHMIDVLNSLGVDCAMVGNHDFDFGVDALIAAINQSRFPWIMVRSFG